MPVEVFGGSATQVAYPSISFLDITDNDITLIWPTSYFNVPSIVDGINYDVLASSIYVTDGVGNTNTITLPDATESSNGASFIITNIGLSSFQLLKSNGVQLILIPESPDTSNSFWVQLTDNSTSEGEWQFVQFGAGTSQAQASALAGNGLVAILDLLNTNIVVKPINASPYDVIISDRAKLLLWQTGTGQMNLPLIADVPAGFYTSVNNEGPGAILTITGDATIDNNATIIVSPGQSLSIISDGTKWWTLGFGQNIASSNFAPGSSLAPSITFTSDTTTGIYYYQTPFPPVTPPGIGFTVSSAQVSNITTSGLYMTPGKTITIQDSTNVSQTILSSNVVYGQLSWQGPLLTNPATLHISGTNTETSLTLGPFAGLTLSESATSADLTYNGHDIFSIDLAGHLTFNLPIIVNDTAAFNSTVTLIAPLSISDGGTGQSTRPLALNALMPPTPAIGDIVFFDATGNWVRLPIGTVGQTLTVTNVGGHLIPQWA